MKRLLAAAGLTAALLSPSACSVSVGPAADTANKASGTDTAKQLAPTPAPAAPATAPAAPAARGARQDFTLVNSTGVEIHKVFISPHDKDEWGEDILGRDTLPSGQSGEVTFNRDEKAAMWDLRVEDSQGEAIEWENLNLLEISKITLYYENGKARAVTE